MKKKIIVLLFVLSYISGFGQKLDNKIKSNNFLEKLTETLSKFEIGSGFTILVFEIKKNKTYKTISVTSSNSRTKFLLDSLLNSNAAFIELKKRKAGFYALPIVQVMFDGNNGNDLFWANNSSWEMKKFQKELALNEHTILLNPIVIVSNPTIR